MADERDPKVSQRYRELGSEEPARELDQAILSAARRSVERPHAPLVTPSGRHRWYFSLGAAAVIVLAFAVTYQMQQEQPDPFATGVSREAVKPPSTPEESPPKPAANVTPQPMRQPRPAEPENGRARESAPPAADSSAAAPAPQAARPAAVPPGFVPEPGPRAEEAPRPEAAQPAETSRGQGAAAPETRMRRDAEAARSLAKPMQAPVVETPERMLERIAELRKQGKNEEADRLLAEFKRRYPDYRIPENVVRP